MKWWRNPRQRVGAICAVVAVLVIVGLVDHPWRDDTESAAHDVGSRALTQTRAPAEAGATASPRVTRATAATGAGAHGSPGSTKQPAKRPSVVKNVVPDLRGVDLQKAWDGARAAGYRFVTTHDASGRGRRQFLYSNWKVCDQEPGPGPSAKEVPVALGVVRHDEKCPAASVPTEEPRIVDGRLPDLTGRSVNIVRAALRGDAHVKARDLDGDRPVLVETHWMVCTQKPAAGQPVPDTVELGVVKYSEHCP
ncbi:hypothetical protein [Streptomyces sp. SID3343]|uniref:hypothetical protein n=1 Tax=Streptomyces sp. SID3343 TaxID=2690260 RepID=UPI0013717D83|nr:hypothetical protein [Streptomyces sp. SID3343]MYW00638.1 hypothetical protein [Streptomyces sp. SID3343]